MPELAELKLTADYVNFASSGRVFEKIEKNPEHKWISISHDSPFTISAKSRGKELMLVLKSDDTERSLMMTMGMGGHFRWVPKGESVKHAHLNFISNEGTLSFVDVRRFGKWKWGTWNSERGPDPTFEFEDFRRNIYDNGFHTKEFDKPMFEVMMNQRWFNGIGNYLRAEILYRVHVDPWDRARIALLRAPEIFDLCRDIPLKVYELGGGQLKDWENPFSGVSDISEIMKCYGNRNMCKVLDRNGRTFWYDPKWKKDD